MARAESKMDGRKGRRSESKTETGKSFAVKPDTALNFTLAAGALGLGIALLEQQKAAAASANLADKSSLDDNHGSNASVAAEQTSHDSDQSRTSYAVHHNGDDTPVAVPTSQQATGSVDSEASQANLPQGSEAVTTAQGNGAVTSDALPDVVAADAQTDADLEGTSPHSITLAGGVVAEAQDTFTAVSSGTAHLNPVADVLDTPANILESVGNIANDLLGSDGVLGSNGVLGIIPAIADTVSIVVGEDNPLSALIDNGLVAGLTSGGDKILDAVASEDGILDGLADAGKNVVDHMIDTGGALAGSLGIAIVDTDSAAASSDAGSAGSSVETGANTESAPADTTSEIPSNIFDVANAALQITEYVADALTPTLKFVGQPFTDADAHADTDHSHNNSTQHSA